MKKILKLFPVAVAAFAMASCSSDDLFGLGESTNIADADGSTITAELVEEGVTRMGVAAGGAGYIWTADDQLNVYSLNSLKFNTYNIKAGAGTKSATFEVVNDNLGLGTTITEGSELYGVTNDKTEKYIYSFAANEDNEPLLTMDMPARFTQTDGALTGALPMPFYSKGITVNAAGGLSMKYNKLAGLLALDLAELPVGTKAIEIYAQDQKLAGTFVANLSDDAPYLAPEAKFDATYNDAIRVDFDAALAAAGPRMVYIPVPVGTYTNFKVAAITADATPESPAFVAGVFQNGVGTFTGQIIFSSTSYKMELKAQTITSAVDVDASAFTSWAQVSQALVNNMDGTHSVNINGLDPATNFDAADGEFMIPVNEGMARSNVVINLASSLKKAVVIKEGVATLGAGNTVTGWTDATSLGSASAAAVKSVTLNLYGVAGAGDLAVDAYLPTSEFVVGSTNAAYNGTIQAITATEGLFVSTTNNLVAVNTLAANTGAITVEAGSVTTLTPTAGDGLITVKGTVTTLSAGILGLTKGIVIGTTGNAGAVTYGKAALGAGETQSSGDIILQDGGSFTAIINYGTGNVNIGQVAAAGAVTNYGGSLTIGSADKTKVSDVAFGAVIQYGTGAVTLQNIVGTTGDVASLTVDSKSDINVTLNNVEISGKLTAAKTVSEVAKAVNVEATDAVIGSLDYDNAATSRFNAYGKTALDGGADGNSAISDANEVLNFYSYYSKDATSPLPNATDTSKDQYIYTAAQLANLATAQDGYTYVIDPRVKQIELAGVDVTKPVVWKGAVIPTGISFTLDCNNVAMKNLKLDNGAGAGNIGLIAATTDAAITIKNVKLSTVQYTESTKADENVGILVGKAGAAVTINAVNIDGLNINSTLANENIGGLVGYATGVATISNAVLAGNNIVSGGANVGGAIGYAKAAPSIDGFTMVVKNLKGAENVGGVVGYAEAGSTKIDKIANNITTLQGTYNVGGVVGYHHGGALSIGGNTSTVTIASLGGNYNIGGTIGSTNGGNVTVSKTKANVTAFATDNLSEDANLAGTVAMAIGYINGVGQDISLDKDCKPSKFLNLKATEKQALKYDKRRYQDLNGWNKFWNGNPYVGYVNGTVGFIKTPNKAANGQETLVNSVNYNVWMSEDETYGDDTNW